MADIEQAKQRFTEIALDWGLQTERTQERLEAVAGYLDRAVKEPEVAVRATQLVLLDPESSGATRRECYKEVLQMLGAAWLDGLRELRLLQAMLLSVGPPQGLNLHSLLNAGFEVIGFRPEHQPRLTSWNAGDAGVSPVDNIPRTFESPSSEVQGISIPPHPAVGELQPERHVSDLNTHQESSVLMRCDETAPLEYLWWGQARYCHTLRQPFRRLYKDDAQRELALLHACMEAAERAKMLAPEPAAAFLVETLRAIGWDVEEVRTVQSWMDSAFNTLRAADGLPALNPALNALAAKDALGLPWTHLRLKVGDPRTHGAQAADILLPPDAEIDRGQWATWIFREAVLNLRMAP